MTKEELQIFKTYCCNNFETILERLNIEPMEFNGYEYRGACPIHGGDNQTSFCFCPEREIWSCFSNQCQDKLGNDIIGFVMGATNLSFDKAIETLSKIFDGDSFVVDSKKEKKKVKNKKAIYDKGCLKKLDDCSPYFKKRGLNSKNIKDFLCGYAHQGKMSRRVVFPVLDNRDDIVGFVGRTIYDKCSECGKFHQKNRKSGEYCQDFTTNSKWMCSRFNKNSIIYNLNNAEKYIKESNEIIIVEGIIDLIKLWENGVKNVVSLLGVSISEQQLIMLLSLGFIKTVYLCCDDDDAGNKFKEKHSEYKDIDSTSYISLSRYFNVRKVGFNGKKDVGEMSNDEIKRLVEKFNWKVFE